MQFYGRIWFRLARPSPDLAQAPGRRRLNGIWRAPACREPSLVAPDEFLFLNELGSLSNVGWDGSQREKLWRYNQHYFDDLNAVSGADRVAWHLELLEDWVRNNPPAVGTGWEPYPTSLRVVNWMKWALSDNDLSERCIQSLAVQIRWLSKRLEIHLLGNHLFANAKALVFAGIFFEGDEADSWLAAGLCILAREVPEQILHDGGQMERSTMYHALALEDMLDLSNLGSCCPAAFGEAGRSQLANWRQCIPRMIKWLHTMCHPDGDISFFNDAALGITPSVMDLNAYGVRLGFDAALGLAFEGPQSLNADTSGQVRIVHLRESGYIRMEATDAVLLLDVAPVGPDYLPGHAHADTLSFEMSLFGQRLIVNSGTACYGTSLERLRQRGTAAHNTVQVDGQDSSEVWGGFRVARRARPIGLTLGSLDSTPLEVRCAHDGYSSLKGQPLHKRCWRLSEYELEVEDQVEGAFVTAEARFHLHPGVQVTVSASGCEGTIILPGNQRLDWRTGPVAARLEPSTYHPRFGVSLPNQCLVLPIKDRRARLYLAWQ